MKKKQIARNTTACGRCVIPSANIALLTKVVKRLQTDGIDFVMEDVDETTYHAQFCDGAGNVHVVKDFRTIEVVPGKVVTGPATIITYGPDVLEGEAYA